MPKWVYSLYIFLAALAFSAVIVLAALATQGRSETFAAVEKNERPHVPAEITTEHINGFVLKEYEGQLAVFRENSATPYRRLDFDVSMLSEDDKELMKTGITVKTLDELEALIEDFTS